jgi:peroxiredoxin Q/BCP
MLQVTDTAPLDLVVHDENGEEVTLRDYLGKWVVVYFYPKDNTPGCTLEAEGFRDMQEDFGKHNAVVLGVSKDSCASHQKFIDGKKLNFTLVADTEHELMEAFGTWQKKKFMGREYMGTSRSTFLLDLEGAIAHVWESVKPSGHPEEVLSVLEDLQKK